MKCNFLTYLFLFFSIFIFSQNNIEKSSIIDSIPIKNTERETYSLYLPNKFDKEVPSAVVFIFDPGAKGKRGIKPFIKASEKYGLILACSNNSKNGSYDKNFKLFNNLSSDVFSKFKINKNEMYLSGFSGGSRLASAIASITNEFSGVIACGAGFPGIPELNPSIKNKYNYVALCGNLDFNYQEMISNKLLLDKLNFNHTLITYSDKHTWPNQDQILKAFDWLYQQKTKNIDSKINRKKIYKHYELDYNKTVEHINNNELIFAAEEYERLIESYSSFFNPDSLKTQLKRLKNSKQYKKQEKLLSNAFKKENEITNSLFMEFHTQVKSPKKIYLIWWKKQIEALNKKKINAKDTETKNMIYRIKFNLFTGLHSTKKFYSNDASSHQKAFTSKVLKLFRDDLFKK